MYAPQNIRNSSFGEEQYMSQNHQIRQDPDVVQTYLCPGHDPATGRDCVWAWVTCTFCLKRINAIDRCSLHIDHDYVLPKTGSRANETSPEVIDERCTCEGNQVSPLYTSLSLYANITITGMASELVASWYQHGERRLQARGHKLLLYTSRGGGRVV